MGKHDRIIEDDEIVIGDFLMERMGDGHIWFAIGGLTFDLYAKGDKLIWMPQAPAGWMGARKDFEEWKEGYDVRQ